MCATPKSPVRERSWPRTYSKALTKSKDRKLWFPNSGVRFFGRDQVPYPFQPRLSPILPLFIYCGGHSDLDRLRETKFRTEFPYFYREKRPEFRRREGFIRTPPNWYGPSSSLPSYCYSFFDLSLPPFNPCLAVNLPPWSGNHRLHNQVKSKCNKSEVANLFTKCLFTIFVPLNPPPSQPAK